MALARMVQWPHVPGFQFDREGCEHPGETGAIQVGALLGTRGPRVALSTSQGAVLDMNGTLAADVVCANVRDALDLLLKPRRLAATLRA